MNDTDKLGCQLGMNPHFPEPHAAGFYLLLLSRSRNHSRLSFPSQKVSWVESCPEGTVTFIQVQSRPLLSDISLLNNYITSSSQSISPNCLCISCYPTFSISSQTCKSLINKSHATNSALCSIAIASAKEITPQFS